MLESSTFKTYKRSGGLTIYFSKIFLNVSAISLSNSGIVSWSYSIDRTTLIIILNNTSLNNWINYLYKIKFLKQFI